MPRSSIERDFVAELSVAGRKLRTLFDSLMRKRGLTLARARVLLQLAKNPGINQTELAAMLEVETPTVVRLLDGMETSGLIRRCAVAGDRRAKRMELTAAAQKQVAEIEALSLAASAALLEGIEIAEIETAIRVLRHFARRAEADLALEETA